MGEEIMEKMQGFEEGFGMEGFVMEGLEEREVMTETAANEETTPVETELVKPEQKAEEVAEETVKETEEEAEKETVEEVTSREIEQCRRDLEEAREAESNAYHMLSRIGITQSQRKALSLRLPEDAGPLDEEQARKRCILLLREYYLPHIAKNGSFELAKEFTVFDDPGKDYIEAVIVGPTGQKETICYNYKLDSDGKSLIIFEKVFDTVVQKAGKPERYILYDDSGEKELASLTPNEVEEMVSRQEMVKLNDCYYMKAKDGVGRLIEGDTTVFVKEGYENGCRTMFGNNEQDSYTLNPQGQLVKRVTNNVTSVMVEKRTLSHSKAIYASEQEAYEAAESLLQENDINRQIEVSAEGTSVAEFDFIPVITTVVDLNGTIKKIGKGLGEMDPNLSDEDNMKKQFAQSVTTYLNEKGYHVISITCENIEADVKENAGFMNAVKTFQIKAGKLSVTYLKVTRGTVALKQGLIRGQKAGDVAPILAQLPEGSELLNPEEIDWKASRPTVTFYSRMKVKGFASAKNVEQADIMAVENAIQEAQREAARGLNGGIASGIRECVSANGAVSTIMGARPALGIPVATKEHMTVTRQMVQYAYSGTYDRETATVSNDQLLYATVWNVKKLAHEDASKPVVERGIPSDENYNRFAEKGDDSGILLFERTDIELKKYIQDAESAQNQTFKLKDDYERARKALAGAQEAFDRAFDSQYSAR